MSKNAHLPVSATRILVKMRPSIALKAADGSINLQPLYRPSSAAPDFGVDAEPAWYVAQLKEAAETPWDLVHSHLVRQLGLVESDVVFAEPDMVHDIYRDAPGDEVESVFAVGGKCDQIPQDVKNGKAPAPELFAWHLEEQYTQLKQARLAVRFSEPRTRIAHLDTGYYRVHQATPQHIQQRLERSFVEGDTSHEGAQDPDNWRLLFDNSGHGTGTLGILAGGEMPAYGSHVLGGAPDAEILPLRIADSVVLLRTSAFARALHYAVDQKCDVVTLSMGGLPSLVWREAIDRAYLEGLCVVAAAGNNINGLPTRHIVYPARYGRVIAVCGAMADNRPYSGLKGLKTVEGNYGPDSSMKTAIAAYTPNIPWARFGCPDLVRFNGEGTSSATPQVAAAVALWFEKYKSELPRDWRRVEAVRHALFSSAISQSSHSKQMGRGILRARAALDIKPALGLEQTKSDNDSFAFLRVITGLGLSDVPPRERMFNLEIAQRWAINPDLQQVVPDPSTLERLDEKKLKKVMEVIISDEGASFALRKHVAARYPALTGGAVPPRLRAEKVVPPVRPACDVQPALQNPPYRRLRVYAGDPGFSGQLTTADLSEVTLQIRWEILEKSGPVGEYLAVEDIDAYGKRYEPVDLDDPRLLAQDGWAPAEGNPQFHQQMVYAVAMKTIEHFERALGRPVLWRAGANPKSPHDDSVFVRQLSIRPHALMQANAFYSPQEAAILFGYFDAPSDIGGDQMPGSRVYTCLSHDIIAHETSHAVLDGMHRHFNEPTNLDVLALHEAFSDIVALLQHFTIPQVLQAEIGRTRGDLESESMLGSLAVQFGRGIGGRGALREAIGKVENGVWMRFAPEPGELQKRRAPHARGAILVAAVFDAFIAIYKSRIADLLRIYTNGTGVLSDGAIHPDLVRRLAEEATKSARHVLDMCIRALDYVPPVDVTFFEYLRALITADFDMVDNDEHHYRIAFMEAFRRRGIYPLNLDNPSLDTPRTLSVDTLRWQSFDLSSLKVKATKNLEKQYEAVIDLLKGYADACFYLKDRKSLFETTQKKRKALHNVLQQAFKTEPEFAREFGLDPAAGQFEVHELRRAMRARPDGTTVPQVIVELTQAVEIAEDGQNGVPSHIFRGGATLVIDLSIPAITYRIVKNVNSSTRRERTAEFMQQAAADPLHAILFGTPRREPFAALHSLASGLS